jgi:phosphocarrier protein
MEKRTVLISNDTGLHARPAANFVKLANTFASEVWIGRADGGEPVSAKKIIKLLTLGLVKNTEVEISAEGSDESQAVSALADFIESGAGESE